MKIYKHQRPKVRTVGRMMIRPHQPVRFWLLVGAVTGMLAAAGYGLYELGRHDAGFSIREADNVIQGMRQNVARLEDATSGLSDKVGMLQGVLNVEREAQTEIERRMTLRDQELRELRQEVAFYRGIISASDKARGLTIDELRVNRVGNNGRYNYRLVLTQVMKNDNVVRGDVKITVEGIENGQPKVLSTRQLLGVAGAAGLKYKFRYFQKLHGSLELPADFEPIQVVVQLVPGGSKSGPRVERIFDWRSLAG